MPRDSVFGAFLVLTFLCASVCATVDHAKDVREIELLKANYARHIDACLRNNGSLPAATRAANLYTDDGAFESAFGNYYGKSQILYGFHVVFGRNTKWSTHFIMSPIIVFTSATTAVGDWYFYAPVVLAGTAHAPVTPFYGGYKDIYQKVNGVWKIKKTTVVYFTPPS